jgi:hypothetical protein
LRDYRNGAVMQLLWRAIAAYVAEHRIELMFGCASLRGTDPQALREQLAYLHHFHLAPPALRPVALADHRAGFEPMARDAIEPTRALRSLEPMVKGYLRAGAWVGEGAWVDRDFGSIDVCIVMPTQRLGRRHREHFERAIRRPLRARARRSARPDAPRTRRGPELGTCAPRRKSLALLRVIALALPPAAGARLHARARLDAAAAAVPRRLRRVLGLRVRYRGEALRGPRRRARATTCPTSTCRCSARLRTRFVAKEDVRAWPLFGLLARLQQTVFISRARHRAGEVGDALAQAARGRARPAAVPGRHDQRRRRVLPFKSSVFAPLVGQSGLRVQPVRIELLPWTGGDRRRRRSRPLRLPRRAPPCCRTCGASCAAVARTAVQLPAAAARGDRRRSQGAGTRGVGRRWRDGPRTAPGARAHEARLQARWLDGWARCAVALAAWLLWRQLQRHGLAQCSAALRALPPAALAACLVATALSFACLAAYERLATQWIAPGKVPRAVAWRVGLEAHALANTLGFHALTAAALRVRTYRAHGIDAPHAGQDRRRHRRLRGRGRGRDRGRRRGLDAVARGPRGHGARGRPVRGGRAGLGGNAPAPDGVALALAFARRAPRAARTARDGLRDRRPVGARARRCAARGTGVRAAVRDRDAARASSATRPAGWACSRRPMLRRPRRPRAPQCSRRCSPTRALQPAALRAGAARVASAGARTRRAPLSSTRDTRA